MLFIRYHFYDSTIQGGIINGTENNTSVHYFSEEIVQKYTLKYRTFYNITFLSNGKNSK